jgi:Xaa-Pro dipeptidase
VARPYFALLPLRGDPVLISHTGHALEARHLSWVKDVREYTRLSEAPVEVILEALRERDLTGGAIGMELGREQTLDISPLEFRRLEEAIRPCRLADAAPALWRLRMIKSEAEVACFREAHHITAAAYAGTFGWAREGMLESDVYTRMHNLLSPPGTGDVFLVITSGEGNYDLVTKPPEARAIGRGDMVWMDAGCTVSGYWSDYSRACVAGPPSSEQQHAQESIGRITADAVAMVRPGVKCSDIARFCLSRIAELDFPVTSRIAELAGRIGHGIGLNLTEPPHLGPYDDTPLEPGMVISIEPGVATAYGTFHIEENLLVTGDGCEVLSLARRDLIELGAA